MCRDVGGHNEVEERSETVVGMHEDVHSHRCSVAVDIGRKEPVSDGHRGQDTAHRKGPGQDMELRVALALHIVHYLVEQIGLTAEQEYFEHAVQSWSVDEVSCVSLQVLPV